jgi:hypothetical protein
LVGVAAAGAAAYGADRILAGGSRSLPSPPPRVLGFRSRPDLLPPGVSISGSYDAPGYLLLSPSVKGGATVPSQTGALIVDGAGQPVYFRPYSGGAVTNLSVDTLRGQPVLSWWQGHINSTGYGYGEGVVVDSAYREVSRIRAGLGRQTDLHELVLTPEGTALITCFPRTVERDLRAIGGPVRGQILENILQEVDVRTGRVVLEWHSLDHIPVSESYAGYRGEPFDYLHVNSIALTPDGQLLISARHTWALYKLDRRTGAVIWRLGGKRSDFQVASGARFSWQHDALQLSAGTITLFDDGSDGPIKTERQSRGLVLDVDEPSRRIGL